MVEISNTQPMVEISNIKNQISKSKYQNFLDEYSGVGLKSLLPCAKLPTQLRLQNEQKAGDRHNFRPVLYCRCQLVFVFITVMSSSELATVLYSTDLLTYH